MDPTLRWLAIGGIFSVGTSALWFIWVRFSRNIQSSIFQFVSEKFNISEHRFSNVSNIVAITRILKLLGLCTNRYLWQHDANADTGDAMMVGYIQLPTRTWFLWSVAMLGISHYIWIKGDATEIVIVGCTESVAALLRVSNVSANRRATDAELEGLRATFGLRSMRNSNEAKCMCLERLIGLSVLSALAYFAYRAHFLLLSAVAASLCVGLCIHVMIDSYNEVWAFVRAALQCFPRRCLRRIFLFRSVNQLADIGGEIEATLLQYVIVADNRTAYETTEASGEIVSAVGRDQADHAEQHDARAQPVCERYSVVIARQTWFEISIQRELPVTSSGLQDIVVPTNSCPILYALPMDDALPYRVAPRVLTLGSLLYVCVHNPMIDINLVEMRELVNKADQNITLVVILPAIHLLERELEVSPKMRLHGYKETRYMASLADLHVWLMLLTSGVFTSLALLLPYASTDFLEASQVWSIAQNTVKTNILGPSNEQNTNPDTAPMRHPT